jgi:hypothetical protein
LRSNIVQDTGSPSFLSEIVHPHGHFQSLHTAHAVRLFCGDTNVRG